MRKVLSFSGFLMLGLVVSQFLPVIAGEGYGTVKSISNILLYVCLSFIMINVGREFVLDKTRWKSYAQDYFIAMATAALPWFMIAIYYVFVLLPPDFWNSWEAWKENLRELDELKHSVQNASYEQKDPLLIYKLESVTLFDSMVNKINNQTVSILMRGQIPVQEAPDEQAARRVEVRQAAPEQRQDMSKYRENKQDLSDPNQQAAASQDTREQQRREPIRAEKTVGRNDPCPCGSGKKYKNCHGKNV